MPKIKTQKSAAARFRVTRTGRLLRTKCGKSHLRRNRGIRAREQYDVMIPTSASDRVRIKRLIPYGAK